MKQNRKSFSPNFSITPAIARWLMQIEAVRRSVDALPITPRVFASLRETARLLLDTLLDGD